MLMPSDEVLLFGVIRELFNFCDYLQNWPNLHDPIRLWLVLPIKNVCLNFAAHRHSITIDAWMDFWQRPSYSFIENKFAIWKLLELVRALFLVNCLSLAINTGFEHLILVARRLVSSTGNVKQILKLINKIFFLYLFWFFWILFKYCASTRELILVRSFIRNPTIKFW
jgi:hypothetical protein